jgi:intracellular septation protein
MMFSAVVLKKNAIKAMLGEQLSLPEAIWGKVNWAWIGFFVTMGILNLLIAFNFPTDVWVNFKLFGGMGLMLLFVLAQGMLLSKYVEEKE